MKTCLVLGGAESLWSDLSRFLGVDGSDGAGSAPCAAGSRWDGVVACNEAGAKWAGPLDAWISLHPRFFLSKGWVADRAKQGHPEPAAFYAQPGARPHIPDHFIRTSDLFPGQAKSGSSGLYAAKVALIDLGFDRVVFCGVPMTVTPHFWDQTRKDWGSAEDFREQWLTVPEEYRNRMRSMSGWTRVLLGAPEPMEETT